MALGRQERFHEEGNVFWSNYKKFVIFMLTVSVLFHESGHIMANYLLGFDIVGFCVFGMCYENGNFLFEESYFLSFGVLKSGSPEFIYSWREIAVLLSGFVFQFSLSYIFLRLLKIRFKFMIPTLLLACIVASSKDFMDIMELIKYI